MHSMWIEAKAEGKPISGRDIVEKVLKKKSQEELLKSQAEKIQLQEEKLKSQEERFDTQAEEMNQMKAAQDKLQHQVLVIARQLPRK
ncbi:unnamed protein product [Linum trigynum]|uniref:Uncharacterized protein n=1 Tax=Linum trigynum TaxID=586398 RepID=A0AAV2D9E0_9ROSI